MIDKLRTHLDRGSLVMTEAHAHEHEHPNYWLIFGILIVLTIISVGSEYVLGASANAVIMVTAVCKAVLVAMFFMHLKLDWFKVYYMVVPALIMGTILLCALLPDITFSMYRILPERPPSAVVGN
jgi:caa(3)-type oxidase subunit IV